MVPYMTTNMTKEHYDILEHLESDCHSIENTSMAEYLAARQRHRRVASLLTSDVAFFAKCVLRRGL